MPRHITIPTANRSKQLAYYHRRKSSGGSNKPPRNPFPVGSFKHRLFDQFKNKKLISKQRSIPFNLDLEWLAAQPDHCSVSGIVFEAGARGPLSASFDKIDPKGGYTKENTRLVCLWVNTAKMNWPDNKIKEYIILAGDYIKSQR